jgi:transcriptional regulator GlxA family with amidase domain
VQGVQERRRIGLVLAKHFTLSAFSLFVDTLRLGGDIDDRSGRLLCDWHVVSGSGHMIAWSSGIKVASTARVGDAALRLHRQCRRPVS